MLKVYSSSAGSGKTYTLTKEYLKLALHTNSDTYYKHILAITFTNAAANEMKDRILSMLRIFSETEFPLQDPHSMLVDVVTELYPQTLEEKSLFEDGCKLICARAQAVFFKILHRYSDFAVMTIDKFTKSLVSSFTDELGLPFVFETQLDSEMLKEAVDRLLARIGAPGEDVLTEIVENYYRERAEEGGSWGALPQTIQSTAGTLLQEEAYLKMQKIANLEMGDWAHIRKSIRAFVKKQNEDIVLSAEKAKSAMEQAGLVDKDFFQGSRGVKGYFDQRAEGLKLWDAPNSFVIKAIDDDIWYGAKTPQPIKDQIDGLKGLFFDCYNAIESIRNQAQPKVLLYQALDKHLYGLSLLGEIRREFDTVLRQNNQVHISDFNRRIAEIVSNEPVPFIFERLGERYNHILLDEFQDTSKLQFANLIPLIENALGGGHFNLVVGDAKQSIYRFRGGDMDLILHLAQDELLALTNKLGNNPLLQQRLESLSANLQVDHLRTNRRSFQEITSFNNSFFSFVAGHLGTSYPMVLSVFDDFFQQQIPEGVKTGGQVQFDFIENSHADAESEGEDEMVLATLERVGDLRGQGYFWKDMAILCRSRRHAATLAGALQQEGVPLISDDALTLAYSRNIQFVISLMKVIQKADDNLARYEAMYLFHHQVRGVNPGPADFQKMRDLAEEMGLDSFLSYFKAWEIDLDAFRLRQSTIFEIAEIIIRVFGLFDAGTENAYLFRFLDVILEFGSGRSSHLGDFLAYWDIARYKVSINVPQGTDALRITTIHKSKGLEYPVVIIPYAQWKTTPSSKDTIWLDLEDESLSELELNESGLGKKLWSSMVSVKKDLGESTVQSQYLDHEVRTVVENLNLLYVAFTRPIQRLYVLAQAPKARHAGNTISGLLYDYLNRKEADPAWVEGQLSYRLQSGDAAAFHLKEDEKKVEPYILHKVLSHDPGNTLRLRRQSDRLFDLETFEVKNDIYQKACYVLTRLRNLEDLPHIIEKVVAEGVAGPKDQESLTHMVASILQLNGMKRLYVPEARVMINKEMLIPGGKQIHIDRMVEIGDGPVVLMRFLPLNRPKETIKTMGKLVEAYNETGKNAVGLVITIENQEMVWIEP